MSQGTIGCKPNSVPMEFIVFNLGILGDENTHKYPRAIGLIYPRLPNTSWEGVLGMFLGSKYLQKQGVWKPRV